MWDIGPQFVFIDSNIPFSDVAARISRNFSIFSGVISAAAGKVR